MASNLICPSGTDEGGLRRKCPQTGCGREMIIKEIRLAQPRKWTAQELDPKQESSDAWAKSVLDAASELDAAADEEGENSSSTSDSDSEVLSGDAELQKFEADI